MEKKNTLLLTIVSVATLLVAVVGATFAYFTATTSGDGTTTATVTTKSLDTVISDNTAISLEVLNSDMLLENGVNDYTAAKTATGTSTLQQIIGNGGGSSECTFDIVYTPTTAFVPTAEATQESLIELAISGVATVEGDGVVSADANFDDFDLANITEATTIKEGVTFTVAGADNDSTLTYTYTLSFYNLALDQSIQAGKTTSGTIGFDTPVCVNTAEATE